MEDKKAFSSIAKPQQKTIRAILQLLENPQNSLKVIHVAGTNGKGSVCTYLRSILTNAGYKTGLFTSPHMLNECERISVDGVPISKKAFSVVTEKILSAVDCLFNNDEDKPTQFELWTVAAFCYFNDCKCDYIILETGLGGTRDATNVITNPIMTVITRIALDHTEFLGNTLPEIAKEKAGIIKKSKYGGCTITISQSDEILNVIHDAAQKNDNEFITVIPPENSVFAENCEIFNYKNIKNIKSSMIGIYQKENAALAVECALKLNIKKEHILKGIYEAKNIGRFEILNKYPTIIFDGAHNADGMKALSMSLKRYFPNKNINFIIGFMRSKDISSAIRFLKDFDSVFYTVEVQNNPRAKKSSDLCKLFKSENLDCIDAKCMKKALSLALNKQSVTIICGSLYLYHDYFDAIIK